MTFDVFNAYSIPEIQVQHAANEILAVVGDLLFRFVEGHASFYLPQ